MKRSLGICLRKSYPLPKQPQSFFYISYSCMYLVCACACLCACAYKYHGTHMKIRRYLLKSLSTMWVLDSGNKYLQPTELSHCPHPWYVLSWSQEEHLDTETHHFLREVRRQFDTGTLIYLQFGQNTERKTPEFSAFLHSDRIL